MVSLCRFLANQPLAVLMVCLAAGFSLGRVRVWKLPANATLATLVVSVAVALALGRAGFWVSFSTQLSGLAFAFFSFAIGYSAGPGFADSIRREGCRVFARQSAVSICYSAIALVAAAAVAHFKCVPSAMSLRGLLAGALTQSTILDSSSACDGMAVVAYGVSYIVGLTVAIVFIQGLAPRLIGTSARAAVKAHIDMAGNPAADGGFVIPARTVQLRSYRVLAGTPLDGGTVAATEAAAAGRFEIAAVHRDGRELPDLSQETRLMAGDVIVVIGDMRVIADLPLERVEESVDDRFVSAEVEMADVVLASLGNGMNVLEDLTARGILLRSAMRDGRPLPRSRLSEVREGDILQVTGLVRAVAGFVKAHGYRLDDGAPSDLATLAFAVGVAAVLGAISIRGVSLGTGGCSLLLGLLCGFANRRRPDIAHLPGAAVALMRSLGLNVFIASLALGSASAISTGATDGAAPSLDAVARIAIAAAFVAIAPLAGTLLIGHRIMRLQPVVLLGGLCGGATCTPALNALEEETGSSAFTAAYTIPYVVSNILLTLLGSILVSLIH